MGASEAPCTLPSGAVPLNEAGEPIHPQSPVLHGQVVEVPEAPDFVVEALRRFGDQRAAATGFAARSRATAKPDGVRAGSYCRECTGHHAEKVCPGRFTERGFDKAQYFASSQWCNYKPAEKNSQGQRYQPCGGRNHMRRHHDRCQQAQNLRRPGGSGAGKGAGTGKATGPYVTGSFGRRTTFTPKKVRITYMRRGMRPAGKGKGRGKGKGARKGKGKGRKVIRRMPGRFVRKEHVRMVTDDGSVLHEWADGDWVDQMINFSPDGLCVFVPEGTEVDCPEGAEEEEEVTEEAEAGDEYADWMELVWESDEEDGDEVSELPVVQETAKRSGEVPVEGTDGGLMEEAASASGSETSVFSDIEREGARYVYLQSSGELVRERHQMQRERPLPEVPGAPSLSRPTSGYSSEVSVEASYRARELSAMNLEPPGRVLEDDLSLIHI